MKINVLASALCLLGLSLIAPSCASNGSGKTLFFGHAPMGSVDSKPIDKVTLGKNKPATNYSGRKAAGPTFDGKAIPAAWPVDNNHEVLSRFGNRGRKFHEGYDIRAAMRTPVLATADGIVKEVDSGGSYGRKVVLDHGDGVETVYAHLDEPKVEVGQRVHAGEQIALSGQSGNATTPHVHYEVHMAGRAVNPGAYLPGEGSPNFITAENASVKGTEEPAEVLDATLPAAATAKAHPKSSPAKVASAKPVKTGKDKASAKSAKGASAKKSASAKNQESEKKAASAKNGKSGATKAATTKVAKPEPAKKKSTAAALAKAPATKASTAKGKPAPAAKASKTAPAKAATAKTPAKKATTAKTSVAPKGKAAPAATTTTTTKKK